MVIRFFVKRYPVRNSYACNLVAYMHINKRQKLWFPNMASLLMNANMNYLHMINSLDLLFFIFIDSSRVPWEQIVWIVWTEPTLYSPCWEWRYMSELFIYTVKHLLGPRLWWVPYSNHSVCPFVSKNFYFCYSFWLVVVVLGLSYFTCVFLLARSFIWNHDLDPLIFDLGVWNLWQGPFWLSLLVYYNQQDMIFISI
jgi:hypothetical protein